MPFSNVPAVRPDAKNAISGASSASVTGRRNARRAKFAMILDAHADSSAGAVDESPRSRPEAPLDAEAGEVGRQIKMALRVGGSTGGPGGLYGAVVGPLRAPPPPPPP